MAQQKIDPLIVAEKHAEWLSNLINSSFANGYDTYITPIRVAYWLSPKTFEFLWTNPGIVGNGFLGSLFSGLFIIKEHYSRQRSLQLTRYSFVASALTKHFDKEVNRDNWHGYTFRHFSDFKMWFNVCSPTIQQLMQQLLQVTSKAEVLDIMATVFEDKKTLSIKELLTWIPDYLHKTKGEIATYDTAYALFKENNVEATINNSDDATIPNQVNDVLLPWYRRWFNKAKWVVGTSLKFIWDHINKYTMGYWISRAAATMLKGPEKHNGSLAANTLTMFLLPLVGVFISFIHVAIKVIRFLRDRFLVGSKAGYTAVEATEEETKKAYLRKISNDNNKLLHLRYFEKQLANLLILKNELQRQELTNQLKLDMVNLNATNNSAYQIPDTAIASALAKVNEALEPSELSQKSITAETIKAKILRNNSWFSGKKSKIFAAGMGTGVSCFAMVAFIFWVAEELLQYLGHTSNIWNFSLFNGGAFLSFSASSLSFIGLGVAVGIGVITGICTAYKTYKTHQEMALKLQQVPIKQALTELAARQNHLNRLRAELGIAQQQELRAIHYYNDLLQNQGRFSRLLLDPKAWQTKQPDFTQFDALHYARYNQTLSFTTSTKTYIKKALNRALVLVSGGNTGTLVPRLFFSMLKVLLVTGSISALFVANPPLAIVLTVLLVASTAFFAGIRLWNYHLDRIKTEQQNFLDLLTPPAGSKEQPLKERLDLQIRVCEKLKRQAASNIALLDDAKNKLIKAPPATKSWEKAPCYTHSSNPQLTFRSAKKGNHGHSQSGSSTRAKPEANVFNNKLSHTSSCIQM